MDPQTATSTLNDLHRHQHRARRAAQTPWWFYLVTFVVIAAVVGSNDFVRADGPELIAAVIVVALAAALVFRLVTGSAALGRARGVQVAVRPSPRRFSLTVIIGSVVGWLFARYGFGLGAVVADALHVPRYPSMVTGVIAGLVFTAVLLIAERLRGGAPTTADRTSR